jgi:hypothetical protein
MTWNKNFTFVPANIIFKCCYRKLDSNLKLLEISEAFMKRFVFYTFLNTGQN